MEIVENIVKTTLGELEKMLSTKTVVGEPISIGGNTIIPLVTIGFAFGAGGGSGKGMGEKSNNGEGSGGGTGGGAGVKPVGIIIIDKDGGVRLEPLRGGIASTIDKLVEKVPEMMAKKKEG